MQLLENYLDFIKFSISSSTEHPRGLEDIDWGQMMELCVHQGILGVVFRGIERCEPKMPQRLLLEWIGSEERIKSQNRQTNKYMLAVTEFFMKRGHRSCILKGQANALMYPHPDLRSPGDIDIWVEGNSVDIIKTVLKETPDAHYSIHHIKMPVFKDVSVEVHYRPMYLNNWWDDKKLQLYIDRIVDEQFSNRVAIEGAEIGVLTDEFNAVYQILHMFAHFFSTRNNLKQLIDYYYLLKKGLTDEEKKRSANMMKELKVLKYARGIMWIMTEKLGLDEKYLILEADEKIGSVVWNEVMKYGTYTNDSLKALLQQTWANLKLANYFPQNVFINPLFLIWHQWWKMRMKWKLR